ncbi:MAG: hypothetical protein RMK89_11315, partial [Armatimonadota bacterium]|nr:hypothetical protein [Armatimonadota bacterium]MDW8144038.1 hypothetical protein [Armatimonadota bacterium]
ILFLLIWRRFFGWEKEGALWAGIGGAVASLTPHARPEGLLLVLAIPFSLTKGSHRLTALSSWLLGLILSLLVFWHTNYSLPSIAWLLNFRVLDFTVDSWRLYGQQLPSFAEFVSANWNAIVERILAKTWMLSIHLAHALNLLWLAVPLALWLWRAKGNWGLQPLVNALPFWGLLFFAVHCFVWSTPAEPRLTLVPLVFFALWLFCLWLRWLQLKEFAPHSLFLFTVTVVIVLAVNACGLGRIWRTEPEWHPKALELATNMTNAMVEPVPMEASKMGCGVVSNMPWLISLRSHRLLALMPLLETPEKFDEFVKEHEPQAFVLLLCGRTPKQAVEKEPRAKAWLIWHQGELKLRQEWASRLELVDWRLFHNRDCVNIVAMLVPKDSQAKPLPL